MTARVRLALLGALLWALAALLFSADHGTWALIAFFAGAAAILPGLDAANQRVSRGRFGDASASAPAAIDCGGGDGGGGGGG